MSQYVLNFSETCFSNIAEAGGKGANLSELGRIEGLHVPDGFCVSTRAFQKIMEETPRVGELLDQLSLLKTGDQKGIIELSSRIRLALEAVHIPADITAEILRRLSGWEANTAFAVRSSATAEDLPTASFAGQQDSFLNISGGEQLLKHICKCWASLFTERAVRYRIQNGFDHRKVQLAVIVQEMIFPEASGIMFTADPVNGDRKVISIDAGFGLGEALVSGLINADVYKVRAGSIMDKKISTKKSGIFPVENGGTHIRDIEAEQQNEQVLTDRQILDLARIGRQIEAHFGSPQDIEWCLADDIIYVVQSRPITTLYPIPYAHDEENHVYLSVGHQQMMTDAMKPLGLSFWLLTNIGDMRTAGGRLYVDVTARLASVSGRETMINVLGKFDPFMKAALTTIVERKDFIKALTPEQEPGAGKGAPLPNYKALNEYDPAIVSGLTGRSQKAIAALQQNISTKSGPELFDFILGDIQQLKQTLSDPESFGVIMAGMNAAAWINEKMNEWLGEKNAADILVQSVPGNVTSEMGLALLDLADAIRPYPEVIGYLQQVKDNDFLKELVHVDGGQQSLDALNAFLGKYGMRCTGEIDITRTRWSEQASILMPMILNNIKNFEPGEAERKFSQGLQEALKKKQELLDRLKDLPDGGQKAEETKKMINVVRKLSGYREYPKYGMMSRYFIYKQALLKEAEKLLEESAINEKEDIFYLSFEELREAVCSRKVDVPLISSRKADFRFYEKLRPPRVITSDGEIISGAYRQEDLPSGALGGLAVSSGIIEGRARVILNMEKANLEAGDILVTAFTDPSWTPLFVAIKGLVTEVGGLMTHGAVIAREYGIAAVVGVENATKLIRDGQRIRVNGTDGYVEIL